MLKEEKKRESWEDLVEGKSRKGGGRGRKREGGVTEVVIGIGGGAEAETGDTGVVARAGIGTGGGEVDQDPEAMEVTGDTAGAEVATEGKKNY